MACAIESACATTDGNTRSAQGGSSFGTVALPARRQLRALIQRAPALRPSAEVALNTNEWRLQGPLPARLESASSPQPFSQTELVERFAQRIAPSGATTNDALRCLAREVAHFALRNEGSAPPAIGQYISAACGLSAPGDAQVFSITAARESATNESLFTELGSQLTEQWRPVLAQATDGVGIALARDGVKIRVVIARSRDVARFDMIAQQPSNEAVVRGEVRGANAEDILTLFVNTPEGGVRVCAPEVGIVAPRFGARCPASAEGAPQYVEVMRVEHGRLLGHTAGMQLVGGAPEARLAWRYTAMPAVAFTNDATTRAALEAQINQRRAAAGRGALVFGEREHRSICELGGFTVGHLSGSVSTEDAELAIMGMMAGWTVEGRVRGGMAGANALTTRDGSLLLSSALEMPSGRLALLDPNASRAVLCPVVIDSKFVGVSYASWQLVDESNAHEIDTVWAQLDAERARAGLAPIRRWSGATRALQTAVTALEQGTQAPQAIIDTLTQSAVDEGQTSVRATAFVVYAPAGAPMQIPRSLMDASIGEAQIAATWFRAPHSPWAVRVVFIVMPSRGNPATT